MIFNTTAAACSLENVTVNKFPLACFDIVSEQIRSELNHVIAKNNDLIAYTQSGQIKHVFGEVWKYFYVAKFS